MIDNNNALICNMEGKVLYFGLTPFLNRIVNSDGCFICGDRPEDKEFNNEHIIPKWLLRKHNLFNKNITLPNGTAIPYSNYKIPCCKDCNSDLSRMVENPISLLLSQPYNDIVNAINTDDSIAKSLYHWLCLIYIKTHLKDNLLPIERDRRKNTGSIGDYHYWEAMHHVHGMARKHYTNAIVDQEVYGTIFILPSIIVDSADKADNFDYADHSTRV